MKLQPRRLINAIALQNLDRSDNNLDLNELLFRENWVQSKINQRCNAALAPPWYPSGDGRLADGVRL